jgi:hypothetical protein
MLLLSVTNLNNTMKVTVWAYIFTLSTSVAAHGFVRSVNIDGALFVLTITFEQVEQPLLTDA